MIGHEAQSFLWGIRLNNEKAWFENNKSTYTDKVQKPMKALADDLWRLMEDKYALGTRPHVSRIYRDARRTHGKGPYKDHLWLSLRRSAEEWTAAPTFFFEITPDDWSYGMVCAFGRSDFMRTFREKVTAEPARFDRLAAGLAERGHFGVWGDEYKRRFPAPSEISEPWFNRKFICFIHEEKWNDRISSPDLAQQLFGEMGAEIELYRYFCEIADVCNGTIV